MLLEWSGKASLKDKKKLTMWRFGEREVQEKKQPEQKH